MIYNLEFIPAAKKEWDKLDSTIKNQFIKKLKERLVNPHIQKDYIAGGNNLYKIKLRVVGYRLVYKITDKTMIILILAVGKRNNNDIYKKLISRIS
jgi:mRNA interferase RelE/StbE